MKTPSLPPVPTPAPVSPGTAAPQFVVPAPSAFPVPSPTATPQTITSWRANGDPCLLVDVTADYLNRLVATPRQSAGPVSDFVLGAQVAGEQTTSSRVSIRTLPSRQSAQFDVLLDGVTCTRTTAMTPQAAIDMKGQQRFDLRKSVEFDGSKFLTRTPATQLEACQQNLRARTGASQIPVVNSIAETIALNQANLRQPIARQETARRVTSQVTPQFNDGIDQRLATANEWFGRLSGSMPNLHQFLTSGRWSSTERSIRGQLAGLEPVTSSAPPLRGGATIRIHESLAGSLAVATQLNGREIPIEQIRQWIGDFDNDLSGAHPNGAMSLSPAADASIRLAESQSLLATFQNAELRVTLRASLKAGATVELPIHRITIGYSVVKTGSAIELRPLPVTVVAESNDLVVGTAVEKLIQSQIESRLQPVTISPEAIPALDNGMRPRISDVASENGWLTVVLD
ncbi:MAG TPA: hypothetical protein VM510_08825 [Caulifigura sp.]|nr:hypothetical protein [Caulifigura sp.]